MGLSIQRGARGPAGRSSRRPRLSSPLVAVSAAIASVQMSWSLVVPVLPDYAARFGLGAADLGLVVAVFGLGRLVVNLPAGLLAQRVDRRTLLVAATLGVVVFQTLTGLATGYAALLVTRLLTGLAGGVAITGGMALLADLTTPERRGRDMATLQGFQLAGGALGPVVGGGLAVAFGSRATFLLSGVATVAVICWAARVLRGLGAPPERETTRGGSGRGWLTRDVWGVCIVGFSVFFHRFGGLQSLIPLIAYQQLGMGAGAVGLLLGGVTLCNVLMVRFAGGLSDRVGRKRVIVPAGFVVAVGSAGLALGDWSPAFVAATLVAGVAAGFSGPTPAAYLVDVTSPSVRGAATGLYRTFGDLGGIIGPLLLGVLAQTCGFAVAATALAGIVAVMTTVFGVVCRETTGPRRASVPEPEPLAVPRAA